MVGISADPVAKSAALAAKHGINFPLLSDEDLAAATAYGIVDADRDIAVPAVFVVKKDGTIAWRYVGDRVDRPSVDLIVSEVNKAR